jgi:hypothetical protein
MELGAGGTQGWRTRAELRDGTQGRSLGLTRLRIARRGGGAQGQHARGRCGAGVKLRAVTRGGGARGDAIWGTELWELLEVELPSCSPANTWLPLFGDAGKKLEASGETRGR